MSLPMDTAIPVPVHFDGHNINIISDTLPTPAPQPKAAAAAAQTNPNKDRQSLYKTELCREWSTSGWCYYGKRCSFAHGLNELRPVFRSKKWRTKRCRNWQSTGYCPYEHRCQFLHDQTPPRQMYDDDQSDDDGESRGKRQQQQQQHKEGGETESDAGGIAGAATTRTTKKKTTTTGGSKTTKSDGMPTAGDGGNQLYFHFDVRPADAEEESEPATDDSENYMTNGEQQQRPPSRRRGRRRGPSTSPPRGEKKSKHPRSQQQPQQQQPLIVTKISRSPSPHLDSVARRRRKTTVGGGGSSGSGSEASPPPNQHHQHQHQQQQFASFGYPNQHISQMEMMQAQQIMANQATANQLAAHLAAAHQHQPFFESKTTTTTTGTTNFAAMQQQQLMAALQRMSSGGSSIANVEGVTIPTGSATGGGGGLAGAAPTMTQQQQQHHHLLQQQQQQQQQQAATMMGGGPSSPPPSVPIDWTGLAGGLPSIPMSQGDTNTALLNAMYTMGPSLTELYYAARLNQMPTAELEQLCMGLYPATAPVPFASTSMAASGPLAGLAGAPTHHAQNVPSGLAGGPLSGVASVRPNMGGGGGGGGGGGSNMVFDPSGLHTPSGSAEPPGFDSAFYPTPSPPPSSFGGLDSVSNLNGIRFVPNDPSGATNAAYGLAYAAAQSQAGAGGPMTPAHFLLPHCSTPVPLASSPPPQMTPTGMYGGFPQFFGGPSIAGAGAAPPQQKGWDAATAAMNAAAASGLSSPNADGVDPNLNGIAFVSGNPNFGRSAGRA